MRRNAGPAAELVATVGPRHDNSLSTLKQFQLEELSEAAAASSVASGRFSGLFAGRKTIELLYVGLPDEEDDFDFKERFIALQAELAGQLQEEEGLNRMILENLAKIAL